MKGSSSSHSGALVTSRRARAARRLLSGGQRGTWHVRCRSQTHRVEGFLALPRVERLPLQGDVTSECSRTGSTSGSRPACVQDRAGRAPARTRTAPASSVRKPATHRSSVVLPLPLAPRNSMRSPALSVMSMPSNRGRPFARQARPRIESQRFVRRSGHKARIIGEDASPPVASETGRCAPPSDAVQRLDVVPGDPGAIRRGDALEQLVEYLPRRVTRHAAPSRGVCRHRAG